MMSVHKMIEGMMHDATNPVSVKEYCILFWTGRLTFDDLEQIAGGQWARRVAALAVERGEGIDEGGLSDDEFEQALSERNWEV